MRQGIFGGSFDPVHLGHLWIALAAIESLRLDVVRWVPTATSPLKPDGPVASDDQRVEMLQLALAGDPQHLIDTREIRRGDVSYTLLTLRELRDESPGDDLFLIVGGDSLASMPRWHRPADVLSTATLAVVRRGGQPPLNWDVLTPPDGPALAAPERIDHMRRHVIDMPMIELSSSGVRDRVAAGRSIRHRVTRGVEAYIDAAGLYR